MFGYVRPPLQALPENEGNRFRRIYCGLCHTLGRRYGAVSRLILNYDLTYLAILLSSGEESECRRGRCAVHPVHGQEYLPQSDALDLAADESVILTYWQIRDGIEDHDWIHSLKYRGMSALLEPAYRKAAGIRPDFAKIVQQQLDLLHQLEAESCDSIDRTADAFAQLLAAAAMSVDDPTRRRVIQQLLYHLGRWIYLIDAADDLEKDAKSGDYNPVALRFALQNGHWTEESRQEFVLSLDHSVHMMTTAFELCDFGVWTPILRETLYSGLFQIGKSVLDGTFRAIPYRNERQKCKRDEETT